MDLQSYPGENGPAAILSRNGATGCAPRTSCTSKSCNGCERLIDTTNTGWGLLVGHQWGPRPGHQWVFFMATDSRDGHPNRGETFTAMRENVRQLPLSARRSTAYRSSNGSRESCAARQLSACIRLRSRGLIPSANLRATASQPGALV